jgi:tripartite-type tricarboxylate transporter receptor subunit TctC
MPGPDEMKSAPICPGLRCALSGLRTALLLAAGLTFFAGAVAAQSYPVKPVRILVGNPPGGGTDITARALAQKLADQWARPVVVDNRPGAAGLIAMELLPQAPADGYTILVVPGSLLASAAAQKKLSFDARGAFAAVSQINALAYMMMINAALPANTLREFIALAKARPNTMSYGSSGIGGMGHLSGALFCQLAGVELVHVPYKGSAPALADMIAGQVQMGVTATISGMPHVRTGRLKVLGVTSAKRVQAFAEVPTLAEAGVPGFDLVNWYGVFAPAKTPGAVIAVLHAEIVRALSAPEVQAVFARDGAEAAPSASPRQFAAQFEHELETWQRYVRLPGFAETLK